MVCVGRKRGFLFSVILCLLISFSFVSNAFAENAIKNSGFQDVNWGASLKDTTKEFILLDFDTNKKLYNYISKEESYFVYDVGFYPIYYQFWNDKFVAVRAYFNVEKDAESFQRLYNNLVSQFGIAAKIENNSGEDIVFWQTEDVYVRLNYNLSAKKGYLYVYNKKLQNDYARFLDAMGKNESDYKNQPQGFEGIKWGAEIKELKKVGKDFKANNKSERLGEFILVGDAKTFMDVPIIEKRYSFWQNQLLAVYVHYKNDANKDLIYQKIKSEYGEPTNGRYDLAKKMQYYIWAGEKTHIILYDFVEKRESFVLFASKELYERQKNQIAN